MVSEKPPVQLTAKGLEKLKEELRYLVEVKRQELSEYMGAALADGDIRESAAYDEARMLQSANEARIADLEEIIHRAVVVDTEREGPLVAQLGATLELEETTGDRSTFQLVGTHEANILEGKISDESPLGQALLGRQAGDKVSVRLGRQEVEYTVLEVRFD